MITTRIAPRSDHSVRSALSAVRRSLASISPRAALVSALEELTRSLRALIKGSDRDLSGASEGPLERFSRAQDANLAEIRRLSSTVRAATSSRLGGVAESARSEAVRACRSQVRKIRIVRSQNSDSPGGEA